ncbi:MAG: SurA N-terminal domain-containing protein [Bacteroidales bacterium]|nr:SurA N-terminal domain-containing protein [Bacteroidales bacterium]MCM1147627.1 SurA N-terminal domain-containing protein [Bacteroidales bacterium]MCM1206418.1 SurA N-terminal domain-containing protein [Bacillota bacterium]MCM1509152.1 SurA N-terminal domain-containing protein [Clostridium sp.]
MAAIGKIRSWGPILIGIVGLALFAFIAEEFVRSADALRKDSSQQVGEVLGNKISVQEYQALVDEYQEVIKMTQGRENLSEEELNQVKDMVWNTYVQTSIVENEASKLGLAVTDQELQNVLKEGTNPMLAQTPFVNQQTGRFDANALKKFLADYKQMQTTNPQQAEQYATVYKYWTFIEKTLRQQILAGKYQVLLANCIMSNPVEAKMAFKDENEEANIQLAAFPYTSVKESDVKVSDADLKAKYEEMKDMFRQMVESRDVKYVSVQVAPSTADRKATLKEMTEFASQLAATEDPAEIVRKSASQVSYLGLPQSGRAFPQDIAARLDSMAVGQVYGPVENKMDNTYNVIKLVSKQELPDSIQFRVIQVGAETVEAARTKADSVYNAVVNTGADFEALAKKYGQTGEKAWMTGVQYEASATIDKDSKAYLQTLMNLGAGQTANVQLASGNIIVQVLDRKAPTTKYVAAVVKRENNFSKDTYSQAYNKFSQFVSESQNAEQLEKNAKKNGYQVMDLTDITTAQHNIAGIRATREAMKWLFDAEEGSVSPLYECGDNNTLLVMVLTNVNKEGFRTLDDERVKSFVKAEALRDKQAEFLMAKAKDAKSVAAAKAKGAQVSSVNQVTFAAPVFVAATGAAEPALSGAVASTKAGAFSKNPVKGNGGVYLFQVVKKSNRPVKYDEKAVMTTQKQKMMQYAGNFMQELYQNANVKDNRYLFF